MGESRRLCPSSAGFLSWSRLIAFVFLLLFFIFLGWLWSRTRAGGVLKSLWFELRYFLVHHEFVLVALLLLLPTFGFPVSLLFVLTGAVWSIRLAMTICFVCLGFNLVFSYFFYRKCLNKFLFRLIFKDKKALDINPRHMSSIRWVLLIQLIPQIPYAGQCYLLATIKDVKFWHYLSISWFFQFLWACGFILGGNFIQLGQWGILGFCLVMLLIYGVNKKLSGRKGTKVSL